MQNEMFVLILGGLSFLFIGWGLRSLPGEKWQIAFAAPVAKLTCGAWRGANYTYYGVFQALAVLVSAALLYVLISALDVFLSPLFVCVLITTLVAVSFAASRVLARVVEKKAHTATIGGAFFAGLLTAPWLIVAANRIVGNGAGFAIPPMPLLAAAGAAYALGEGLGRLACISFGCCYGKPVSRLHPILQGLFRKHSFVFRGRTKKIAYEAGLDGTPVVPIQAITSVFLVLAGLAATCLFLHAHYSAAFLLAAISTQAWRCLSETLRADYRGKGRVSAYQVMAALAIPYALFLWMSFPVELHARPDIAAGIRRIWNPVPILLLQALGAAVFLAAGRSRVTGSFLTLYVRQDRV